MKELTNHSVPRYSRDDMSRALETLRNGGVILYPTDTIWGLGCDATNPEAVEKIYFLKGRSESKAMLALVGNEGQLQNCVHHIPEISWELIEAAVRPLTIIYDHPKGLAHNMLAPDGSVGIRITSENFSRTLCQRFGKPIVSTSANRSGMKSPKTFAEISDDIKSKVDYIVEYGRGNNLPASASDIIKISDGGLVKVEGADRYRSAPSLFIWCFVVYFNASFTASLGTISSLKT